MIQKFRKKPVEIEAYQITRELLEANQLLSKVNLPI